MRKTLLAVAVAVLSTTALFADDLHPGSNNISAYLSDLGFTSSSTTGDNWSGGAGVALEHAWTNRITTVLSLGAERHRLFNTHFVPVNSQGPVPVSSYSDEYTYPIDLMARYHFNNTSRWTPYVGAGGRFVKAPDAVEPQYVIDTNGLYRVVGARRLENRVSPEINAGVIFHITPRVGLQIDGKRLVRGDSVGFDPLNKVSIGVSWRF